MLEKYYLIWLPAPNEAVKSAPRIAVKPGDLARGVDAPWLGVDRTRWVKAGDGAPAIANEAVHSAPRIHVRPRDLARGVDARWRGLERTRWVKAGEGLSVD